MGGQDQGRSDGRAGALAEDQAARLEGRHRQVPHGQGLPASTGRAVQHLSDASGEHVILSPKCEAEGQAARLQSWLQGLLRNTRLRVAAAVQNGGDQLPARDYDFEASALYRFCTLLR